MPGPRNVTASPPPPEHRRQVAEGRSAARAATVARGEGSRVEERIRDLVDEVSEADPYAGEDSDVLLDLEVDGIRCLLVATRIGTDQPALLSPREQEIARMVAQGYPNKTIAAVLEISSWTVSTHLRRVFAKLGVRSRAAMVARLVGEHLLPEEQDAPHERRPR
jgi:DNA-binding CsgD family transcriptional regulator